MGDYFVQAQVQNPHAARPLIIPYRVMKNTPATEIDLNIKTNAARDLEWLTGEPAHDRPAVMVGGGASAEDYLDTIKSLQKAGGTVYALNAASKWLGSHGIVADYQVMVDAKKASVELVDPNAKGHLFGSQVHPETMAAVESPIVWHIGGEEIESLFPPEKVKRGGYVLLGGGSAVGNSAMCVAYAKGHRKFHVFGYDSCHKDGRSHAYDQPMNRLLPVTQVTWGEKTFTASLAMKAHAEWFQILSRKLIEGGSEIEVYGDGLMQAMFRTKPEDMTERDKYRTLWRTDSYRTFAPGEHAVAKFLEVAKPEGTIIDFGCGTGRASLTLAERGHSVMLVDFADNCRDEEAQELPFLEWDLTQPCHLKAPYGLCVDVMEHIPTADVDAVIMNVMASARTVFFQISTVPDGFGAMIGAVLHNTVRPSWWWADTFRGLGFKTLWQEADEASCRFLVTQTEARS